MAAAISKTEMTPSGHVFPDREKGNVEIQRKEQRERITREETLTVRILPWNIKSLSFLEI